MPLDDSPYVPPVDYAGPDTSAGQATLTVTTSAVTDPSALPNIGQMRDPPTGMLLGYGQSISYQFDSGLLPEAVMAADGTVPEFIQTHARTAVKIITAVSLAVGMEAPIPCCDTQSDNDVLLSKVIESFSPGRTLDGSKVYGTFVRYVYALKQVPGPGDSLDRGSTPFDTDTPAANVLQPSAFQCYLTAPSAAVSGNSLGGIC